MDAVELDIFSDGDEIRTMMMESFGLEPDDVSPRRTERGTVGESTDDFAVHGRRLFGVDAMFVFTHDETVEDVFDRNDGLADYLDAEVFSKVDSCTANILVDEDFMSVVRERFGEWLDGLDRGEVLMYDDFLRALFGDDLVSCMLGPRMCGELVGGIRSDDARFSRMPHIVRIA